MKLASHTTPTVSTVKQGIGAGERHTIVGSDPAQQAELLESLFEHSESIGFLCGVQRLAGV